MFLNHEEAGAIHNTIFSASTDSVIAIYTTKSSSLIFSP